MRKCLGGCVVYGTIHRVFFLHPDPVQGLFDLEVLMWNMDGVIAFLHDQVTAPRRVADHNNRLAFQQKQFA